MSGGSLNYAYRIVEDIKNELGEKRLEFEIPNSEEESIIRQEIESITEILNKLPERLKNLEWWLSADIGDLTYAIRIREGRNQL